MASATQQGDGVADPTGARRIRRNASLAAAEQMEGLRCLDMMAEYRQCICKEEIGLSVEMCIASCSRLSPVPPVLHSRGVLQVQDAEDTDLQLHQVEDVQRP
ncbi:hypothetical protein GBAR_LOCUS13481 [Geodia barretti]|uniref:Uncharacterized protein n=1 Tax=Geodia barretti TaxID=519541 RepID=A0AA35WIS8_GEOBA|nr:hypothetical protein GBAR_LOCUS13481 [Geodia barretti]